MAKGGALVVDDAKPVAMVIEANLKIAGYEVITAFSGREAMEKLREHRPDCVILDVMMPKMNGWETLEAIRNGDSIAYTQVIMLTALGDESDVWRVCDRGLDMYLTQPFEPDELLPFAGGVMEMAHGRELVGDRDNEHL